MLQLGIGAFTEEIRNRLDNMFRERKIPMTSTIQIEDREPEDRSEILAEVFGLTIRYSDIDPDVLDMLGW